MEELRKECDTVLAAHNGQWTKAALQDLVLVESAIKESMRLSVRVVGMHRMVSQPAVALLWLLSRFTNTFDR